MKIAIYKDNLSAGRGADKAVRCFAVEMAKRGFEVNLFDISRFAEAVLEPCDVFVATGSNELVAISKLYPNSFPWPVVLQLHIHPVALFKKDFLRYRKWRYNRALRRAIKRVSIVQVLLHSHVKDLQRIIGPGCPQIAVIGNAMPHIEPINNGVIEYRPIVLYPAALQLRLKRQDFLVKAFALLADEFPDWFLHLYGEGKDEDKLRRLIARLGLTERVLLKGYGDLSEAYRTCAFVAFTSVREGFPLTILEAARYKKTCITCTPSMKDVINDGVTGRITSATVREFSTALREQMLNQLHSIAMGEAAFSSVGTRYTPDLITKQWEELLKRLNQGSEK